MKVLLIGSGGREHALAWALRRSPSLRRLRAAPGNAGIAELADPLPLAPTDLDGLVEHAVAERYDLVVVGPEAPLVAGLADRLTAAGIPVFGPSAAASVLEGSKVFAKRFMSRHAVPTAEFEVFEEIEAARRHLRSPDLDYPLVLKADGLAAGKGVILAADAAEAVAAAEGMLDGSAFGDAGRRIVVEELLEGREASFFVLADGERFVELATCRDYKRALDGDRGPNTGGMGSYSPSPSLDDATRAAIVDRIVRPTIRGLAAEESPYRGVLYVGLMLTAQGPRVLEFNARFGDPETQVLLPRLDGDWLDTLHACATGDLGRTELAWRSDAAVCVVMASGGYPGRHRTGVPVEGLEEIRGLEGVEVFHAGTALDAAGRCVTAGGRVLGVTALGPELAVARQRAYAAVARIRFAGEHHRTDIAAEAASNLGGRR